MQKVRFFNAVCVVGGGVHKYSNFLKAPLIFLLIIAAVLFTACPQPSQNSVPEENPENKASYPQTLSESEKSQISSLESSTLSQSLESLEKIITVLNSHKNEEGVSSILSLMTLICDKAKESGINDCLDEALDENQTIQTLEANANAIQSTIIALDTSYTDENGLTQSYKNADDYNAAREDAINKIDEYWNYAHGDYLVALCDCKIHAEYDSFSLFASELLQDYKENYHLNMEYNQDDFESLLDSALTEVQKLKKTYDAALKILEEYEAAAKEAVETANSFELLRQDGTSTSPVIENPPEDNNEEENPAPTDPDTPAPVTPDPEITYTDAAITDISQITDWTKVGNITLIASPDVDGSLDVMSYYNLKKAVDDKIASLSDGHSRTVAFADYPATVKSFKISMPSDKTNVELMNSIVNPEELEFSDIEDYSTVAEREAKIKKTEVIPGVNLVSYPAEYFSKASPYNNIQQAFEFEKNTTVTMPSGKYDLGYNGGIIAKKGVTLTILNLANADMEGTIYKENIPAIYDKFVSGKSASELPKLSLEFISRGADNYKTSDSHLGVDGVNLYGTDIDHIISAYYNNGLKDRFDFSGSAHFTFDAREYNGGVMYEENTFKSAYNLDTNAALLMNSVANVNVVGSKDPSITENEITSIMNTRIEADMSDVKFIGHAYGVLDIAGTQSGPLTLPDTNGRIIIRDGAVSGENSSISLFGANQVDLSEVSEEDVSKIYTRGDYYTFVNFKSENAAKKTNVGATAKTYYGTEKRFGGVSAQQIVERANNGEDVDSYISQLSPRKVAPIKSELLRAIL